MRRVTLIATLAGVVLCAQAAHAQFPANDPIRDLEQRLEMQQAEIKALQQQLHEQNTANTGPMWQPPVPPDPQFTTTNFGTNAANHESLETRLEAVEKAVEVREAKEAAKTTSLFASGKPSLKLSGRIHLDYWAFPGDSPGVNAFETGDPNMSPQDRFVFRRMRLGAAGDIPDTMRYKLEMEFAGGNDVEYRDVYLGFSDLYFFQTILIGNQKRPYGLDHLNSSRFNVFLERPFVIEGFNQDARRLGICAYGVSDNLAYNWRYGVYNQRLVQDESGYINDHYQLQGAARFANTIWYDESSGGRGYAHWALSGTVAETDGFGGDLNEAEFRTRPEARSTRRWLDTGRIVGAQWYELLGVEGVLNLGSTQIVAEYQNVWLQRSEIEGPDLFFHGGYIYIAQFLTGEFMPWDRESGTLDRVELLEQFFCVPRCCGGHGSGWGAWQVACRLSYADFSDQDILGGVGTAATFGLNWYWTDHSKLQFNYIVGQISDHAPVAGQTQGSYQITGARFVCDF